MKFKSNLIASYRKEVFEPQKQKNWKFKRNYNDFRSSEFKRSKF